MVHWWALKTKFARVNEANLFLFIFIPKAFIMHQWIWEKITLSGCWVTDLIIISKSIAPQILKEK